MPLVSSVLMLQKAQENSYAVPAFNIENMEMLQAVLSAAEEVGSPVILQTTSSTVKYASLRLYAAMGTAAAESCSVPVAIHLDHGSSFDLCRQAVSSGYTSVMIDGSQLPYEKNVEVSRKVTEIAKVAGVPVEAELGAVGGKEDDHELKDKDALYTNPDQAEDFVCRTGIDSLAVAIGTAHGIYKSEPKLDFERLLAIRRKVSVPLVLHGASGISEKAIGEAIGLGICKINFATELRSAYTDGIREALKDPAVFDPKVYGNAGKKSVYRLVLEKIRMCGSGQ